MKTKDDSIYEGDGDDLSQNYTPDDKFSDDGVDMNLTQESEDVGKLTEADMATKKSIKEKAMKARQDDNIRKILRDRT
jgi:hypothetical protein